MNSAVVFFDVGGTLVDAPDFFEVITKKLIDRWPDEQTYALISRTFFQMFPHDEPNSSFVTVEEMLGNTLSLLAKQYQYKNISNQAREIYIEVFLRKSSLFPETKKVLNKLYKSGITMVLASDADAEIMEEELARYDLNKYFIAKCISSSVRAYKPTFGFINNLRKYTVNMQNSCYFVGDSAVDIESGRRLGIKSVLVDRIGKKNHINADYNIRDLNGLLPILGIL